MSTIEHAGHAIRAHVATDRVVTSARRDLAPAVDSMLSPILAAVRDAKTPEALRAAIFDLADQGPPQSLAKGLRGAMVKAFEIGAASGIAESAG